MRLLREYSSALIFLATMVIGGSLLLNSWVDEVVLASFSLFITRAAELVLQAWGLEVGRQAQTLFAIDHNFVMYISNNCNGMWAHLIFFASILAYPATVKEKVIGLTVGQTLILLLSVVRSASLFAVGVYVPLVFWATHLYVWQFLLIAFALVLLFVWAEKIVAQPAEARWGAGQAAAGPCPCDRA